MSTLKNKTSACLRKTPLSEFLKPDFLLIYLDTLSRQAHFFVIFLSWWVYIYIKLYPFTKGTGIWESQFPLVTHKFKLLSFDSMPQTSGTLNPIPSSSPRSSPIFVHFPPGQWEYSPADCSSFAVPLQV